VLFRKQIRDIDNNFITHIDTNIRLYYKLTPEQTRDMKLTDKKQLYIDLLYYKQKQDK